MEYKRLALPVEVHSALKTRAKLAKRTMAAELETMLEDSSKGSLERGGLAIREWLDTANGEK